MAKLAVLGQDNVGDFLVSATFSGTAGPVPLIEGRRQQQIGEACGTLGVAPVDGSLIIKAENAGQMLESIALLMQAVISVEAICR